MSLINPLFFYFFIHMILFHEIRYAVKITIPSVFLRKNCTMRVLNVAEKNDASKNIAWHLSGGNVFKVISIFNVIAYLAH